MIGLKNLGNFLISLPKSNGVLFHHKMMKNLKGLGFELIDEWYEIEDSNGNIEQDDDLRFIEVISRNSFVKNLVKNEKYQNGNRSVTVSSYYANFEDLVTGISERVVISSNFNGYASHRFNCQ